MGARTTRTFDTVQRLGAWLVLPVSALLFLQWPLREWVQRGSREANDLGQCLFALYVALAIAAATRANMHLTAGSISARYRPPTRHRLRVAGIVFGVVPWIAFVGWSSRSTVWASAVGLERFPDTGNAGYFIVKLALWLLLACLLVASVLDLGAGKARAKANPP